MTNQELMQAMQQAGRLTIVSVGDTTKLDREPFKTDFGKFACEGDFIQCERDGWMVRARIVRDVDARIDDDDSHNIDQEVTGCDDDQQNWLLKCRRAWFDDQWFYCGIVLSVYRNGIAVIEDNAASLWRIECNYPQKDSSKNGNAYLREVANELFSESIEAAEKQRERIVAALSK